LASYIEGILGFTLSKYIFQEVYPISLTIMFGFVKEMRAYDDENEQRKNPELSGEKKDV